jgi:hypothetical protein
MALARQCNQHGKQSACDELARIAREDSNPAVRYAATVMVADQPLLAKIALQDPDANVRRAAIGKVTDQRLLSSIALNTPDPGVANVALGKLTDSSFLADVAVNAKDAKVRRSAIERIADPLLLAKIATQSKDADVRSTAAAKLIDQSLLAKMAREDEDAGVRSVAAGKLVDQSLLAKIAQEDKDPAVRSAAVVKLSDQPLLAQIALHDPTAEVRRVAVESLTDQSLVRKIAVEDSDASVRSAAAQRLGDRTVLASIARGDKDNGVREAAAATLVTAQREHEVCIWRATKVDTYLARWKIRGILGPSGLMPPFVPSIVDMQNLKELLFGLDRGLSPAPGFEKGWWFAPYDEHPGWVLESGSTSVYQGNGHVELRPGISFRRNMLEGGGGSWWGSLGGRPEASLTLQPLLYPTSEGTLALGGLGFSPPRSALFFVMVYASPTLALETLMPARPAIVTGTIRFPDDEWREVGGGFRIKGGGLQFDETGVFLIPGTQYNPRDVFLLATNPAAAGSDIDGLAPLFKAAYLGQKGSAASLLANPAEVNAKDEDGRTPLHYAAVRGNSGVAQLLLENHAEVNSKDNRGWTALHFATDRGQKEVAQLLLAHQAEINARNNDGATALHLAAEHGYKDLAELLLVDHAEVNALDFQGSTPLHRAALNGQIDVTELLRQHGGQPLSDFSGSRPLDPKLMGLMEKIVILPVVDTRIDTRLTIDLQGAGEQVQKALEKKGYQVLLADAPPPGDRWVLRFTLIDLIGGVEPVANLYGTLFDNQSGTVGWQAIAYGVNRMLTDATPPPRNLYEATVNATSQLSDVTFRALTLGRARRKAVDEALSNLVKGVPDCAKAK